MAQLLNNLLIQSRPDIMNEWLFEKNINIDVNKITHGSDKIAWWKCSSCNSEYDMKIELRARKNINCPYCAGKRINHTNSLASLKPHLAKQWHPTKNGKLTPYDVTHYSGTIVWWNCFKCNNDYKSRIGSRSDGNGCPYCSGQKVNNTNSLTSINPKLASEWHPTKNGNLTPNDVPKSARRKVWWKCELGHEWESAVYSRSTGIGCPYCTNKKVFVGFNDMWTTNPKLASLLANPEDGYKYTQFSNQKLDWKCVWCKEMVVDIPISTASIHRPSCNNCKVGKSFGEKLIGNILYINNIGFIREKTFIWSENRKYDFYLHDLNIIIEVHGLQHYEHGFESLGGKTLEEEQLNDKHKYELAIANGIIPENYIVLDCRKSDFDFIINSIKNTPLPNLLSNKEYRDALSIRVDPLAIKSSELYMKNMSVKQIAKIIGYSSASVRKFLKIGNVLGINNYVPISKKNGTRVVQMDTKFNEIQIWNSRNEIYAINNIKSIALSTLDKVVVSRGFVWCRESDYCKFVEKYKGVHLNEKQ